jgi:hypothetical protein
MIPDQKQELVSRPSVDGRMWRWADRAVLHWPAGYFGRYVTFMNDTATLTVLGVLLTALVFVLFIHRRISARKGIVPVVPLGWSRPEKKPLTATTESNKVPAAILAGEVRRPLPEINHMLGAGMLCGTVLAALSLFLYSDISENRQWWISFPFLALGLMMAAAGPFLGSRLDRASRVERIAGLLAYGLDVELYQVVCLISGIVFMILAVLTAGIYERDTGLMVLVISSTLGLVLAGIGIWRSRLSRWIIGIPGLGAPPIKDPKNK